jgi:Ca2+-binding EF-hand superfamily protein
MMRRNRLLSTGLAATTALGALTLPALAHEPQRNEWRGQGYGTMGEMSDHAHAQGYGPRGERGEHGRGFDEHHGMMEVMRQMHGGMGAGIMGSPGLMGMGSMGSMMQAFDANGDGSVTPDEMRSGLEGRLAEFDADNSGTLSIEEFEALHSAMIRESMVDRFQTLDNDGDGEVTVEEMTAPADRFQRMQDMRTRMMEQRPGPADAGSPPGTMPMQDMNTEGGMMEGGMMDESPMQQDRATEPSDN